MRSGIHPKYFETVIKCACGYESSVRSTTNDIHVEICSNCHPFYTGKQKLVDTAGRIDKFNRKFQKVQSLKAKKTEKQTAVEIPAKATATSELPKEATAPQ